MRPDFLDHLMRQNPSKMFTVVKRSYFMKGRIQHPLGGGIEAFKGVYQSIRATQVPTIRKIYLHSY